jgi:hypothetical protein
MIRVTVELVPFGRDDMARRIGTLLVANDGTLRGTDTGNYVYVVRDDVSGYREGKVTDHDRSGTVWDLVGKCITAEGK